MGLTNQAIVDQQESLYLRQIEIQREPITLDVEEHLPMAVALEGVATDKNAIEQLADYLRTRGPFTQVKLNTSDLPVVGKQRTFAFTIECQN